MLSMDPRCPGWLGLPPCMDTDKPVSHLRRASILLDLLSYLQHGPNINTLICLLDCFGKQVMRLSTYKYDELWQ